MKFLIGNQKATWSATKMNDNDDDDMLLSSIFGRMFCCAATMNATRGHPDDDEETDGPWIDLHRARECGKQGNGVESKMDSLLQMKSKYLASLTPTKKRSLVGAYSDRVASTPLRVEEENERRLCHPVPLIDDDDDVFSDISSRGTAATESISSEFSDSVGYGVTLVQSDDDEDGNSVQSRIALAYSYIDTRDDDEKENIDPAKELDMLVEEGLVIARDANNINRNRNRSNKKSSRMGGNDWKDHRDESVNEERDVAFPPELELARVFSSASISHDVEYADQIVAEVDREREENAMISTPVPTTPNRFMFYNRSDFYYCRKRRGSHETIPTYNFQFKESPKHNRRYNDSL